MYQAPTKSGYFGKFGGKFVPEILIPALEELELAYVHQSFRNVCWPTNTVNLL